MGRRDIILFALLVVGIVLIAAGVLYLVTGGA
jgi:hypothetical protein